MASASAAFASIAFTKTTPRPSSLLSARATRAAPLADSESSTPQMIAPFTDPPLLVSSSLAALAHRRHRATNPCPSSGHPICVRYDGGRLPVQTYACAKMRILFAGATGVLARATLPHLRRHRVVGLTRSPQKRRLLHELGAEAIVCDVQDRAPERIAGREASASVADSVCGALVIAEAERFLRGR